MAENKRYYWLKLMDDFFDSKRIKKLRKMAGGDTYTIIYLKMQLLSLKKGGYLEYSGLEDEFYKEIALDIDEDEINVQVTIQYLLSCGLLETSDSIEYKLPFVQDNLGSETASTRRSRKSRENAQKALQCNSGATECNILQQNCNVEIDIEKDIEIEVSTTKVALIPKNLECIVIAWNNLNLSTIKSIQNTRLKLLNARIKDYGIDGVLQAINNIKESSFLKGQNNKNWTITFDWLIKPSNFIKVLEGNYTDKEDGSNARNIKKDNRTSEKPKYDFSCF